MSTTAPARLGLDTCDKFVAHIHSVCRTDAGRRAGLRRALRRPPEQAHTAHATVARWLPHQPTPAQEWAMYAVAAMIAAQPGRQRDDQPNDEPAPPDAKTPIEKAAGPVRRSSLGTALGMAVRHPQSPRQAMGEATAEARLHLLVRQNLTGVHQHLPALVRRIRSLGVPIDWAQLVRDLSWWGTDRDAIAKRWLQDFYRTATINPLQETT
ncbi:type I-E CRISPR-associated protein Cse2/CasB [Micromonospora sp. NPDC048898]|uniref:type I-E CRISPR-associated protein Cse2/CasB n=1 Tax=Micromonospora sp. NPDC048898 TaxID=3364260 RepID=UPI003712A557